MLVMDLALGLLGALTALAFLSTLSTLVARGWLPNPARASARLGTLVARGRLLISALGIVFLSAFLASSEDYNLSGGASVAILGLAWVALGLAILAFLALLGVGPEEYDLNKELLVDMGLRMAAVTILCLTWAVLGLAILAILALLAPLGVVAVARAI